MARIRNFKASEEQVGLYKDSWTKTYEGYGEKEGIIISGHVGLVQQNGGKHYNVYVNCTDSENNILFNKIVRWVSTLAEAKQKRNRLLKDCYVKVNES